MKFENNATRHNVESYETATIFDADGKVIFSTGATLGDGMTISELENKARELGNAAKMTVCLNGYRSSWYSWSADYSGWRTVF